MRGRAPLASVLVLAGCSLAPFEPIVSGDGGQRPDAQGTDASGADAARIDAARIDASGGHEDCTNGTDDDADGDVDCADRDCGEFTCVPAPPAGWMGPVFTSAAGCATESAATIAEGGEGLRGGAVTCDACACGSPTGATCRASVYARTGADCGGTLDILTLTNGTCTTGSAASVSNVDTMPEATCAVTSESPPRITDAPAPTYREPLSVCQRGGGGGCGAGTVCAALPAGSESCVTRAGDVECPSELPSRRVVVSAVDDLRACSSCTCRAAGTCGGTIAAYGTGCGTPIQTIAEGTACVNLASTASSFRYTATITGAMCSTGGGVSQGCVAPAEVRTVCCSAGPVCPAGRGPTMVHLDGPSGGRPYCIDTTEVTNAQYAEFLESGPSGAQPAPCETNDDLTPDGWPPAADEADLPVTGVDWCDARAFCEWAGKRLCALTDGTTDGEQSDERSADRSEWVHACRATGSDPLDCNGGGIEAVRSSPCCQADGVYDLPGNAEEWTGTCSSLSGFLGSCVTHQGTRCDETRSRGRRDSPDDLGFRCCADPS